MLKTPRIIIFNVQWRIAVRCPLREGAVLAEGPFWNDERRNLLEYPSNLYLATVFQSYRGHKSNGNGSQRCGDPISFYRSVFLSHRHQKRKYVLSAKGQRSLMIFLLAGNFLSLFKVSPSSNSLK